ncbi:uncharacterized protein LOC133498828 [Syngnathoides biaculeatus]|uniref:uncharacterized protein LOC133498828 n=1 Tax=Syngnathoides biaculeatus TaxID=300417 RepID=UPI002ADE2B63|nr:uncharacterized protein LOC133498828 [Syngnathoides biaculeatus]
MLPPAPYPNFLLEHSQPPEPQTDTHPSREVSADLPHTHATDSVLHEISLQRPPPFRTGSPTEQPSWPRGLNVSGAQQDHPVESLMAEDESQRNTSQSPMTSNDPRSRVTPQSPPWLPVLEKHDVPIVVGVGVSLAFIFITVAFYSVVQKNEPAPTGRAAEEIEKTMQTHVPRKRRAALEELMVDNAVCNRLPSSERFHKDKLASACVKLFDAYHYDFYLALLGNRPLRLDDILCYKTSTVCVDIKEEEEDIDEEFVGDTENKLTDAFQKDDNEKVHVEKTVPPALKEEF